MAIKSMDELIKELDIIIEQIDHINTTLKENHYGITITKKPERNESK